MPPQHRIGVRRTKPSTNNDRTDRDGLTVGEVFESAIADVLQMRNTIGFKGVVDVGVTFKSVAVDREGFISVVIGGNDSKETTTQIQIATRVHLDEDA